MYKCEVIVSRCNTSGTHAFGLTLRETFPQYAWEVLPNVGYLRQKGTSVTVRPLYNDQNGSFHEYRSFNGEEFRKVTFGT